MQGMYGEDALGGGSFSEIVWSFQVCEGFVKCFISCIGSLFLSVACLVAAISVVDYCRIVALSMFNVVYIF